MTETAAVFAPDWKYTNRDVRKDPQLRTLAIDYLQEYDGDFRPLLLACRELADTGDLMVTTIRTVLNCMKNDYTVAGLLPRPARPLVLITPASRVEKDECKLDTLHAPHTVGRNGYCVGKSRHRFVLPVYVKVAHVKARTGSQIHLVANDQHYCEYYPNSYGPGFREVRFSVRVKCKHPGRIVNPVLLNARQAHALVGEPSRPGLSGSVDIILCHRCFPEVYAR